MEDPGAAFLLVGNVPNFFHSADLRCHFSHYTEGNYFKCFHYRHRPEEFRSKDGLRNVPLESQEVSTAEASISAPKRTTHCCVVAVYNAKVQAFLEKCHGKNWTRQNGSFLPGKVRIARLNVEETEVGGDVSSASSIPWTELTSLPELNPPTVMPQGNVGTPLSTFMALIRACKLPSHVIRKLRLEFPKSRSSKRYGAVSFEYGSKGKCSKRREGVVGSGGEEEKGGQSLEKVYASDNVKEEEEEKEEQGVCGVKVEQNKGEDTDGDISNDDADANDKEEDIPSDDDHDAEEWERYEAYHDDVDKQGRCKERLFEEEMEVVWEKGGSGLVFYTDASYWDQQEGDFDERCSQEDHWDVDMAVYYDPEGGGRDGKDLRDIERARRLREGEDTTGWKIGGFEKHTKGIGSKVLARAGWVAGEGVGASKQGISEPLASEGQVPSVKKGLGYRGEKLSRLQGSAKKQKLMKDVIISTVYDKPLEHSSTLLRSAPPTVLKHRSVAFKEGGVLLQEKNRSGVEETGTPQRHAGEPS